MDKLSISTKAPELLIESIYEKIDDNVIRSWSYEKAKRIIKHKGNQYKDAFYFELEVDDEKGLLVFNLEVTGNEWAAGKSFQLLESMLVGHFKNQIAIVKY